MQLPLFTPPSCALPGCTTAVPAWGDVCQDCRDAFGSHLVEVPGEPLTEAQLTERDTTVRTVVAARTTPADQPVTRRNQRCVWCDERRTCTETPKGWECHRCQTL